MLIRVCKPDTECKSQPETQRLIFSSQPTRSDSAWLEGERAKNLPPWTD